MKRLMMLTLVCLGLGLGQGCVTEQGRLAVIDIDFRKDKQLAAGAREAEAPYRDWSREEQPVLNEPKTESLPLTWWETLFNMIAKLECRITLVRIEWANPKSDRPKLPEPPTTPSVPQAPVQ